MIVTRTPFRITLGGGGTDLPSYYRAHGGFVFAMGIDRYLYVTLNRPAVGAGVRVAHSRVETVGRVAELEHELAREALLRHGIEDRVDVSSVADVPGGTGLGSSGAYLVGLLAALHANGANGARGEQGAGPVSPVSPAELAEEACAIELDVLGRRVGKQDQYMAAHGGLTVLEIGRDGAVAVRPVAPPDGALDALIANTHLYYTGVRRSAAEVLKDQDAAMSAGASAPSDRAAAESLHRIRALGERILATIEAGDIDGWGRLLHEHWETKKRLSSRVSLGAVDELYDHVRAGYGVLGGKIAGAGGGGFLMLYCPADHARLEAFMTERGMPRLHYRLAATGARLLVGADGDGAAPAAAAAGAAAGPAADPASGPAAGRPRSPS